MKNEDRIVELLAESLQKFDRLTERVGQMVERQDRMVERQDRMVERQDRMENLMEQMVDSQSKTIGRLDRVEQAIISLANGINEFVEIHRQTTKTQNDRISNLERRMDRLEGNS